MIDELIERYPVLKVCQRDIENATERIIKCYENGGKLLLCGNGGSAADSDHIVGELMKGFLKKRPVSEEQKSLMKKRFGGISDTTLERLQSGLPAISLPSISVLNSAFCNDVDPSLIYAQSLFALACEGDVLIAISTSGNAENVCLATEVARALGVTVISLTGQSGGRLKALSDICIAVPETETFKVQELHLPVYHTLCAEVEEYFFAK